MNPSTDNKENKSTGFPVKKIVDDIFMKKLRKKRLLLYMLTNVDPFTRMWTIYVHLAGTIKSVLTDTENKWALLSCTGH